MRDYFLKNQTLPNGPPVFVQRAMNWAKATNEIAGVIRGLLADGEVSTSEATYLRKWIQQRPELLCDSLVAALSRRVERIFADGIVTPEELVELKEVLSEFAPAEEQTPTQLPLDRPLPAVVIPDKAFCFTGTFISGTRAWCEDQIIVRGGRIQNFPKLPNFLVIGSKVSGAWRNQTYGKKIEAAVAAKDAGRELWIINEDHWLGFLS